MAAAVIAAVITCIFLFLLLLHGWETGQPQDVRFPAVLPRLSDAGLARGLGSAAPAPLGAGAIVTVQLVD